MGLWDDLKSYWGDAAKQGAGWDIHDVYDWFPGIESGEEKARMQKLRDAYGAMPQPPGISHQQINYMDQLRELSGMSPGAGYQQTPLYRGLMSDVEQQNRRMGWANSAQQGRSGVMSGAGYGPGQQLQTERGEAVGRLRQQAGSQAWQAQVQAQAQQFQRVLAAAGFTSDIQNTDWEQRFRAWGAQVGLAQAEIEAAVERQRMLMGLLGQGASAYAAYLGIPGKNVGGGSGPAGEAGGGLLPGAVG